METQADISARQLAEMQAERRPWVSIDLAVGSITWGPDGAKVIGSYELKTRDTDRNERFRTRRGRTIFRT